MKIFLLGFFLWPCFLFAQLAYQAPAYEVKTDALLYTENFSLFKNEVGELIASVNYVSPENEVLGIKKVKFKYSRLAPEFETIQYSRDLIEGVTYDGDELVLYRQFISTQVREEKRVPIQPNIVADAGFHYFILQEWDSLISGGSIPIQFALPNQLKLYPLLVKYKGERQWNSRAVQSFEIVFGNVLFRWLVPPIRLRYDSETKALLSFEGISNLLFEKGQRVVRLEMVYR